MELSSRDISDVIFGRIALMCIVNYACVEMYCRENNVPLSFHHDQNEQLRIIVDSKPNGGEVCEGLWNRLLLEALSLRSFKDLIKAIMDEYGEPA